MEKAELVSIYQLLTFKLANKKMRMLQGLTFLHQWLNAKGFIQEWSKQQESGLKEEE